MPNAAQATVTPITTEKKTRERDDISKAGTLARKLRKNSEQQAAENARHQARLTELVEENERLTGEASEAVVELARKLLGE
jgi:hypothetical protein